jgi:hypothetical protein
MFPLIHYAMSYVMEVRVPEDHAESEDRTWRDDLCPYKAQQGAHS